MKYYSRIVGGELHIESDLNRTVNQEFRRRAYPTAIISPAKAGKFRVENPCHGLSAEAGFEETSRLLWEKFGIPRQALHVLAESSS